MRKLFSLGIVCLVANLSFAQKTDSIKEIAIDEVQINATRTSSKLKDIPQKVEIIDAKTIGSIPASNMAELLKKSVNLDMVHYPGIASSVGMRGFSPSAHSRSYTLVLLNGVPIGTSNLASINCDNVERIEIIKGPYSSLYGSDAMGGVINIITISPSKKVQGVAQIDAGTFGRIGLKGNVSAPVFDSTFIVFGFDRSQQFAEYRIGRKNILNISPTDKIVLDHASYGDIMRNSEWEKTQLNAGITHLFNPKWSAKAVLYYFNADDVHTPGNYWGSYGQSKKSIERLNVSTNIFQKNKNGSLSIVPYFANELTDNFSDNTDTGYISFEGIIKEYGMKVHKNWNIDKKFSILVGYDADMHNYRSARFSDKGIGTAPYKPDYKNSKLAGFTQLSFKQNNFQANVGGRFDYIYFSIDKNDSLQGTGGNSNYRTFNPSVGVQYTFTSGVKLHSSSGTAFSVPDAFKTAGYYEVSEYFPAWDYWWVKKYAGNHELRPESSLSYDGGIGYQSANRVASVDFTYFETRHTDKIIETHKGDTTTYMNANNSFMNGLEAIGKLNVGPVFSKTIKLEVFANFTFMFNNYAEISLTDSNGKDSLVNQDILYARKCNGNFGIEFDSYTGFSLRLQGRYIGSRLEKDNFSKLRPEFTKENYYSNGGYTLADKIIEFPEHVVFDVSAAYSISNKEFRINLWNVLDENYTEKDGYNMPGRMISAQFKYIF